MPEQPACGVCFLWAFRYEKTYTRARITGRTSRRIGNIASAAATTRRVLTKCLPVASDNPFTGPRALHRTFESTPKHRPERKRQDHYRIGPLHDHLHRRKVLVVGDPSSRIRQHHVSDIVQHFSVGSLQPVREKSHILQIDMRRTGLPGDRRSQCRLSAVAEHRHPVTQRVIQFNAIHASGDGQKNSSSTTESRYPRPPR
jgi:hypothetical protein